MVGRPVLGASASSSSMAYNFIGNCFRQGGWRPRSSSFRGACGIAAVALVILLYLPLQTADRMADHEMEEYELILHGCLLERWRRWLERSVTWHAPKEGLIIPYIAGYLWRHAYRILSSNWSL